jgi:hypothetical protein
VMRFELPLEPLNRAGVSWTSIFPSEFVQELPNLLTRLRALGLVMQDGITHTATAKGRRLCALSQSRITRQRALKAPKWVNLSVEVRDYQPVRLGALLSCRESSSNENRGTENDGGL